jgi:hypothetical protein
VGHTKGVGVHVPVTKPDQCLLYVNPGDHLLWNASALFDFLCQIEDKYAAGVGGSYL